MDFLLRQNLLPVVIAVAVIVISWYLWRRKSKGPNSNSEQEPLKSGVEKIETVTSDKVSTKPTSFLASLFNSVRYKIKVASVEIATFSSFTRIINSSFLFYKIRFS